MLFWVGDGVCEHSAYVFRFIEILLKTWSHENVCPENYVPVVYIMVMCAHTVVMYVIYRGNPNKHGVLSSKVPSDCECSHSGYVCCSTGGTPD